MKLSLGSSEKYQNVEIFSKKFTLFTLNEIYLNYNSIFTLQVIPMYQGSFTSICAEPLLLVELID